MFDLQIRQAWTVFTQACLKGVISDWSHDIGRNEAILFLESVYTVVFTFDKKQGR
jgi:hypothetical protein